MIKPQSRQEKPPANSRMVGNAEVKRLFLGTPSLDREWLENPFRIICRVILREWSRLQPQSIDAIKMLSGGTIREIVRLPHGTARVLQNRF